MNEYNNVRCPDYLNDSTPRKAMNKRPQTGEIWTTTGGLIILIVHADRGHCLSNVLNDKPGQSKVLVKVNDELMYTNPHMISFCPMAQYGEKIADCDHGVFDTVMHEIRSMFGAEDPAPADDRPGNVKRHAALCEELTDIYDRKNHDYGNSFHLTWQEYGPTMLAIRLDDKLGRLKKLIKADARVKDESIRDTLLDLANYAIMGVMEL